MALVAGLNSVTFRKLTVDEVVEAAGAAGIAAIEWTGDAHVRAGDLDAAHHVRSACRAAGITIASYGSYWSPALPGDARPPAGDIDAIPSVDDVLTTTVALGARHVRAWAGSRGSVTATTDERRTITDGLRSFVLAAARRGIDVSVEWHGGTLTDTAESAVALLDAVNLPNLWTYWQPRNTTTDADNLSELGELGSRLSHIHVFWWENFLERHALDQGAPLWRKALASAATRTGWTGDRYAFIEFVRDDAVDSFVADARALTCWIAELR